MEHRALIGCAAPFFLVAILGIGLSSTVPDYDRDEWGRYKTVPGPRDGCVWSQRLQVIWDHSRKQDWTVIDAGGVCMMLRAEVRFPYEGTSGDEVWRNVRPSEIELDHRVPLAEAHRSGGWRWNRARKRAFFNDAKNLVPVTPEMNREKSDTDPGGESGFEGRRRASWWPKDRCRYAGAWRRAKREWGLLEDGLEKLRLDRVLAECR